MKRIIFTIIMMLFISTTIFANEVKPTNYFNTFKIENISEAYVNVPANVKWIQLDNEETSEFINIRSNNEYMFKHLKYKIDGNRIIFNSDRSLDVIYDYNMESPINICIYSKKNIKISTSNDNMLIHGKNYDDVLTNGK